MTVPVYLVPPTILFSDIHNNQLWTDDEMVSVAAKASLRKEMKVVLKGLTKEARWVVVNRPTQLICKHTKEIAGQSISFFCHSAQYFLVFPSRSYLASLFPSSFLAVSLLLLSWYVSFLPFPVSCCQSRAVTKLGEMTKTIFNSTL